MPLVLEDRETGRLAREVARLTGESVAEAVRTALSERFEREKRRRRQAKPGSPTATLTEIALHCAALPDRDVRTPDEIIGYDEYGVPR